MYTPEHHPNCPRFASFEAGECESNAPACECVDCAACKGNGDIFAGDDGYEVIFLSCAACEGIGRVINPS